MEDLPIEVEELISLIERSEGEPLRLVTDAVILSDRLGEMADEVVDHFVQQAREAGASWAQIGLSLGVSKQAAQKRFVEGRRGWVRRSKGLFTRFAESARSTVKKAVGHAEQLGSEEVNTLHLVMALSDTESGASYQAITLLAGSVDPLVDAAREAAAGTSKPSKARHIPFASDAKKVLELSLREAIRSESRHIGTEHILLGLLRDERSSGAQLLEGHGVSYRGVEQWLEDNPVTDR